jgi:hypothetical protein
MDSVDAKPVPVTLTDVWTGPLEGDRTIVAAAGLSWAERCIGRSARAAGVNNANPEAPTATARTNPNSSSQTVARRAGLSE